MCFTGTLSSKIKSTMTGRTFCSSLIPYSSTILRTSSHHMANVVFIAFSSLTFHIKIQLKSLIYPFSLKIISYDRRRRDCHFHFWNVGGRWNAIYRWNWTPSSIFCANFDFWTFDKGEWITNKSSIISFMIIFT